MFIMRQIAPVMGIVAVLLWGLSFTSGKIVYQQLDTYGLLFWRMVISSTVFIPYLIYCVHKRGFPKIKILGILVAIGIINYPITLGFQFLGLQYTHASVASITVGLEGTATMLLAYWVLKQKPTKSNIIVAVMAFVGLLFAIGVPDDAKLTGVGLILCANVTAGAGIILNKPLFKHLNAIEITAWTIVIGTMVIVIVNPYFGGIPSVAHLTNEVWISLIAISLGATSLAYILYTVCLQYLSATRTAQFIVVEPLVGVLAGVHILNEPFTLNIIIGACMVMGAILVNSLVDDGH